MPAPNPSNGARRQVVELPAAPVQNQAGNFSGILNNPFALAQGRSAQVLKWTIPAGELKSWPAFGQMFYVKELYEAGTGNAVNDLEIRGDIAASNPYNVGCGEGYGTLFNNIEVRNPNAVAVYLELYVGFGSTIGFIDNRLNIVRVRPESVQTMIDGRSEGVGADTAPISLAATTGDDYDGVPPAGFLYRRSITVTNLDDANPLYLRDDAGGVLGVIWPEETQVYFLSGAVEVYNPSATDAVEYFAGEIWWEAPL